MKKGPHFDLAPPSNKKDPATALYSRKRVSYSLTTEQSEGREFDPHSG